MERTAGEGRVAGVFLVMTGAGAVLDRMAPGLGLVLLLVGAVLLVTRQRREAGGQRLENDLGSGRNA